MTPGPGVLMPCPQCGLQDVMVREEVVLNAFTAKGDAWEVEGKANVVQCIHGHCANCGAIFDVARRAIPVQYPSLSCPQCRNKRLLRYRLKAVTQKNGGFQFTARVECRTCGLAKTLKKALSFVGKIKRLKVSWLGVEIERE